MSKLKAYAVTQPAVAIRNLDAAIARMAELFAAVPADRHITSEKVRRESGTLYAFENHTYFEILDPVGEGHQRQRFVDRHGPAFYMISVDLANDDPVEVEGELKRMNKRVVQPSPPRGNIKQGWHIHPKDACDLLMLLAIKYDRNDNREWAGPEHHLDIPGNTRYVREVAGVIARTSDPASEQACFGDMGFEMTELRDGGWGWRGATGNVLELWPPNGWQGPSLDERRDYAVVLRPKDRAGLLARMERMGLSFTHGLASGRSLSTVDPTLGCRFAVDPE